MDRGITKEDKDLVLDAIVIGLVHDIVERDLKVIPQSHLKLKEPYISMLERLEKEVWHDRKEIKKQLSKRGIKIYEVKPVNEDFVEYGYLVRGYESNMRFLKYALRNYTISRMDHYFGNNS